MGHLGSHGDFCDCQWDCQWDFCDQRHLEMGLKMVCIPPKRAIVIGTIMMISINTFWATISSDKPI